MKAARAIGLSRFKAIRFIIMPQALRFAIPAWSNEPVSLLNSTAVVFLIAIPEVMSKAKAIASRTYDSIGAYLAGAVMYLAAVYIVILLMNWLERATRLPGFEMEGKKA